MDQNFFKIKNGFPVSEGARLNAKRVNFRKKIFGILGNLVLSIGVAFGVITVQNQQIFGEKAAEPPATQKIAEIAKEIQKSNIKTYASAKLGYQIKFDENYWTPESAASLSIADQEKLSFSLNPNAGIAKIDFSVKKMDAGLVKNPEGINLDILSGQVARETVPLSQEKIRRQGRDFYKFTYGANFLNQTGKYFEYLTVNGENYYIITARYPEFGNAGNLSESFIDSFLFLPLKPNVQGASTSSVSDESKIVELTKPSVVEIAHLFCNNIQFSNTSGSTFLKPNYSFCDGALGSGFIINKDGYVATNGHVVKQYPDASLIEGLLSGNPFAQPFFLDLVREVALLQTGQIVDEAQAKVLLNDLKQNPTNFGSFVTLIYKMIQQKVMLITPAQEKYYVKLANDPLVIDQGKAVNDFVNSIAAGATIKEAGLLAFNYPNQISADAVLNGKKEVGSDIAIIKIANAGGFNFPSINLGTSENLKEGGDVIVIGYPGLVSGNAANGLINERSSATPTITKGIISAIKNDQGGLKLIQVDASIDHGNSGGPAIDTNGNVIGIATYGVESASGNFNFLRDIEDLKKLAGENGVSIGSSQTYNEWASALNYFWKNRYKEAIPVFNKIEKEYPVHPLAASYVADSESAIQKGQDRSNLIFLLLNDRPTQIEAGVTFLASVLITVTFQYFIRIRRRKIPQIYYQPA